MNFSDDRQTLVERIQEIENRKTALAIRKIELRAKLNQITVAEAQLQKELEYAASADNFLRRSIFVEEFCKFYKIHYRTAEHVESLAEAATMAIQCLYPAWAVDPIAITSVATLIGYVVIKRGIDTVCNV